jgi:nicotinamide-nucleotide amidase
MRIELITSGTELMLGQVLNTHLGFLSDELGGLGLEIARHTTVPDGPAIREALGEAWARSRVVFLTGGLGPTTDDLTRDIIAEMFDAPLEHHPEIVAAIRAYFTARGLEMPGAVEVQAMVPRGARVLPNRHGTAPGFHWTQGERHLFCLPGPPRELVPMFRDSVRPVLVGLVPEGAPLLRAQFRIAGLGESMVQEKIGARLATVEGLDVGYCARPGEVDLRLTTRSAADLERASDWVRETFGMSIYATGSGTMEETVVRLAREAGVTLTVAESCTGGLVAHRLTNVPGASAVLGRSWVVYSNEAKQEELGVPEDLLAAHGAVSGPVARAMAEGALRRSGAGLAVAVTGIAGPAGGTPEKPVGTVWFGLAWSGPGGPGASVLHKTLVPERMTFKNMASQTALDLLRRHLIGRAAGG